LVESLSDREVEILQLLAEGCANREISERLYISLSTVKGHASNIYGKLLARNRSEAVARARALGILPGD
jgi:LuxR family maltose regulon positive regulatory protein